MTAPDITEARNGVSAHQGAGTPFPLGPEANGDALEVLEFARVLEQVAGYAAGPAGAARVRARLPSADVAWIRAELGPVAELIVLLGRGDAVTAFAVPELAGVLARLRLDGSVLEGPELAAVHRTLAAARQTGAELKRIAGEAPLAAALRVTPPEPALEKRLAESVDEAGELLDSASPALFRARREVHAARERLVRKLEAMLHGLDPSAASSGGGVTVRNGRYVIPVRRDGRGRPDGIVHDESASAGTLFVEPAAAIELGNALRAAIAEADREALRVLRELTERLRPHAEALGAAHAMCVAFDDLVARARYGHAVGAAVPAVRPPGEGLVLRAARHPLLLGRGLDVVPFDLSLGDGELTLLISGPNTGGKTVLLKTVGLAALLVQSGVAPPLGEGSALPVFRRVAADIGDHQSIAADLSTFSAHVATLRRVLEEADAATLVLIDEIGSGTDPAEGAALAAAALGALTHRGARTIATTHLGALKALAAQTAGIVNGSLQFDAERLAPTFRFEKGMPGRSYGLAIARRLGVPAGVLADAEGRVSEAERALDRLLEAAELRVRGLTADQTALAERLGDAERETARLARQGEQQAARERELRAREKDAERRARAEARRVLLDARERVEEALRAAARASDERSATEARRVLEDAIRLEGEALAESAAPDAAAAGEGEGGALAPGQRVRLPTGSTAELLELRGDGKAVVLAGAMRMVVPVDGLSAVPGSSEARSAKRAHPDVRESTGESGAPMEIDLRGLRGDEAEAVTVAALDAAVLADHPYLKIIHGMGTGVVRERVRRLLGADRRVVKFEFAPRNQGGTGVTIAELGG
jgi:DNA mismatch repair protein MutS2